VNRPRKFYGWTQDGKFRVSLRQFYGWAPSSRAANWYDSKAEAEADAIAGRTDRGGPKPSIEWEHEGG
jgi:hypothetical protein